MADTKREIERKYESEGAGLPDLTGVAEVATVLDRGTAELDATYYDTADLRLAASSVTLRRRTGGSDAGWHLKFPVAPGVRDEIRAPLSDDVPAELAALVRSRVRHAPLLPQVRLRSRRDVRHLLDADGRLLAEASEDTVHAERLTGDHRHAHWNEIEIELADDGDPAFLDRLEKRLRKAGLHPSGSASKLARALEETTPGKDPRRHAEPRPPVTAGDHVLAYVRAQRNTLVELDPAVRRDVEDSVHGMRVATRRLRAAFRAYRKVLDRTVTDPIGAELKWLAEELGAGRDQEVLAAHLTTALDDLPPALVTGPLRDRLHTWSAVRHEAARRRLTDALDSERHLALLDALDTLLADPPLRPAGTRAPKKVLTKAVRKELTRLTTLVDHALDLPPGPERDLALHEARKAAKRTRYAAEAAAPALGKRTERLIGSVKAVQTLLGDHHDSVMARAALHDLAERARAAGEDTFTYGLLYGREERRAERAERELPGLWAPVVRDTAL
ncbi:CYTH and CHAD domain-containing protein [Streptomyces sp. NPDC006186]|uniref:CYTH and CHAD domain-containing protein n=1 Tax=Streptomyces sp. NPDC006186 TaxID=3155248 RepID=UPI0033A88321